MNLALLDLIVEQGGVALFAALALFFMYMVFKEALRRERANAETHRHDKLRIVDVLTDVAKSNTELCMLIRELRSDLKERTK